MKVSDMVTFMVMFVGMIGLAFLITIAIVGCI